MPNNSVSQYLAILRRRGWMILLLFAITMTVILVSGLTAKPLYQSAIRLQIIPVEPEQVALYSPVRATTGDVIDLIGYQFNQMVRSSKIAWRTITQLGLNMDAQQLLNKLSTVQEYGFITVIVGAESPEAAEAIVTAQVENALAAYRADQSRPAVVTGEFIDEQLASAEQALAAARSELLRFKLTHSLESLDREIIAYQDIVRNLRTRKQDAALAEAQLTARISALEAEVDRAEAEAESAPADSPARAEAIRRASDLRSQIAGLRGELAGQRGLQAEFERAIAQWETELTSLIGLAEEYTRLSSAVTQAQNTRDFLFNKSLEAQLKQRQALSVGYLKIVEPARRPEQPLPNRTLQIALIGGVLSLVAGAILALLFEFVESLARHPRPRATL